MAAIRGPVRVNLGSNLDEDSCMQNRRRFLSVWAGLGTGIIGRTNNAFGARAVEATQPHSLSDYERRLSQTDRLELLGVPRDWSVIRQGFHPFAPERIAILPSGDLLCCDKRYGFEFYYRVGERTTAYGSRAGSDDPPLSDEKKGSFYATMDLVASHYRMHRFIEDWVARLAFWGTVNPSQSGEELVLLPWFQGREEIPVDRPPVDWWLFLFPDGLDWNSPDGKPARALMAPVTRVSLSSRPRRLRHFVAWLSRQLGEKVDWLKVARMGSLDAALFLNPIVAEILDEFPC
jgi:hypothetical protein